jgi:uncharacterized membrane protein YhaH (DUF805 family)
LKKSDESLGFWHRYVLIFGDGISNMGRFDGRENRASYWRLFAVVFVAFYACISVVFIFSEIVLFGLGSEILAGGLYGVSSSFLVVGWLSVLAAPTARRLRDAGRSVWWALSILPSLAATSVSVTTMGLDVDLGERYSWYEPIELLAVFSFAPVVGILVWKLSRPSVAM